jgi:hypothetical protein
MEDDLLALGLLATIDITAFTLIRFPSGAESEHGVCGGVSRDPGSAGVLAGLADLPRRSARLRRSVALPLFPTLN